MASGYNNRYQSSSSENPNTEDRPDKWEPPSTKRLSVGTRQDKRLQCEPAWKTFKTEVDYYQDGKDEVYTLEDSNTLNPLKMQFLMKNESGKITNCIYQLGYKFEAVDCCLRIKSFSKETKKSHAVHVVNTLEDLCMDLDIKLLPSTFSSIQKYSINLTEGIFLLSESSQLFIVGYKDSISKFEAELQALQNESSKLNTDEIDTKSQTKNERQMTNKPHIAPQDYEAQLSREQIEFIHAFDFLSQLQKDFPKSATFKLNDVESKVIFFGFEEQVKRYESKLKEYLSRVKQSSKEIKDNMAFKCMKTNSFRAYCEKELRKKSLRCVWKLDETKSSIETYALSDEMAVTAAHTIAKCVVCTPLRGIPDIEQAVASKEIQVLLGDGAIIESCPEGYILCGTDDAVVHIKEKIQDYKYNPPRKETTVIEHPKACYLFQKFRKELQDLESQLDIEIQLKTERTSPGLSITGTRDGIDKAKDQIFGQGNLVDHIFSEVWRSRDKKITDNCSKECTNKALHQLAEKNNCFAVVKEDILPCQIKYRKCWLNQNDSCLRVILVEGCVVNTKSDAMFCPVNYSLVPIGEGLDIFRSGGHDEFMEDTSNFNKNFGRENPEKRLKVGECYLSNRTGHLPCNVIIYGVMQLQGPCIKSEVQSCLLGVIEKAKEMGFQSLSLSLHGHEDYNVQNYAELVMDVVVEQLSYLTCVKEIYLCTDKDVSDVMKSLDKKMETKERQNKTKIWHIDFKSLPAMSTVSCPKSFRRGSIKIEVERGSLAAQEVDVIVNSVGPYLDLSKGNTSKNILQYAGESIQLDCKEQFPHGISLGHVICTIAGKLKCKMICHGTLTKWLPEGQFALKILKSVMFQSLFMTHKRGYTSIAFPSLGLGKLQYPYQQVAEVMFQSVDEFSEMFPDSSIKCVKFVLFPKDSHAIEVFDNIKKFRDLNAKKDGLQLDTSNEQKILKSLIVGHMQIEVHPLTSSYICESDTILEITFDNMDTESETSVIKTDWSDGGYRVATVKVTDSGNSVDAYKFAMKEFLKETNKFRFLSADIILQDTNDVKKLKKNVKAIKEALMAGSCEPLYLQFVKILVPKKSFDKLLTCIFEKKIQKEKVQEAWWKKPYKYIKEYVKTVSPPWEIVNRERIPLHKELEIEVFGLSENEVKKTLNDIKTQISTDFKVKQSLPPASQTISKTSKDGDSTVKNLHQDGLQYENDLDSLTRSSKKALQADFKQGSPEVSTMNTKRNIICKITAEVNQAIFELNIKVLESLKKDLEQNWHVSVKLDSQNKSMKLEGCNLNDVKKVESFILTKLKEMSEREYKRDYSSDSDYEDIEHITISQREFETLMHFWGNDYMKANKNIKFYYDKQACLVEGNTKGENLKERIKDEVDKIHIMTYTEIPFQKSEQAKAKSCCQTLQSEFKDVYFYFDEDKFILHAVGNYTYQQKQQITHRAKLLTGQIKETKRNRRFAAGEDIPVGQNDNQSKQNDFTSLPGSLSSHGSKSLSSQRTTVEKRRFATQEGIDIFVYSQSILQLNVDCIVNAANERLGHGAGVAAVIARAAGYELEQEGREYIREHGEIPVGECCHTTAGKLPYKYVIHTVGPRWNNYMTFGEQNQCKKELQNAIESCFYEADTLKMRSIGVPSVSAGLFGMPPYICAVQYCKAVLNYSQHRTWKFQSPTLKEIHFIDMNIEMCKQIEDVFSKCGDLREVLGTPVSSKPSNIPTSSRHSFSGSSYSRSLSNSSSGKREDDASSSMEEMVFAPCTWITIHLLQGSITNVKDVSAVVSPENLGFKHQGRISKDILAKSDEDYIDRLEILKKKPTSMKDIFTMDCSEGMPWRHVLYVIAPRWNEEYVQKNQQFETDLKDTVVNILSELQMKGTQSLAVPLLGTAVSGKQTPMDTCCRAMLDGIWSIINKGTRTKRWKLDLWIVTTDPSAITTFKEMLDTKIGSKSSNNQEDSGSINLKDQKTDDKTLDEDCCICMDKITDPKWLPCKHVFCTDCIDQQFTFKPSCPQCGAVYGIVTGDQPKGTMKTAKYSYSLPGYGSCKTIAVTYSFPAGYQSEEHPNPGKYYAGIQRTGYLPDNERGRLVAKLLRVAFDRRLVFTIGRSVTTGHEGVITWNDIHHKTRTDGGQQGFGYPDETYLDRVMDELAAKGVNKDSLNN